MSCSQPRGTSGLGDTLLAMRPFVQALLEGVQCAGAVDALGAGWCWCQKWWGTDLALAAFWCQTFTGHQHMDRHRSPKLRTPRPPVKIVVEEWFLPSGSPRV